MVICNLVVLVLSFSFCLNINAIPLRKGWMKNGAEEHTNPTNTRRKTEKEQVFRFYKKTEGRQKRQKKKQLEEKEKQ